LNEADIISLFFALTLWLSVFGFSYHILILNLN